MNALTYKGYSAQVEFDADDELFIGHVFGLNDVVGFHADHVDGLKGAFREAVDDYLATCARIGKRPDKVYSGNVMFRVPQALHARIAAAAALSGKSLNQWGEETLERAVSAGSR
jgi:predicted HicB family RNase H-like nuclease